MSLKNDNDEAISSSQSYSETFANNTLCLICCDGELPKNRGITPCKHDDVCGPCHLRLRFLHADKRCPICKAENQMIVCDEDVKGQNHRTYDEYSIWGEDLGTDFVYREDAGIFFKKDYHEKEVVPLFGFQCGMGCAPGKKPALKALQDHLKKKHEMEICQLCITAKRDFVSRLPRFTAAKMKHHVNKGDETTGDKGHPLCHFCKPKRFYDLTKLHEHLNKEHYKCFVCDKRGLANQFFNNYDKLAVHFGKKHFFCTDPQCLAARFVVFENEIDFIAHNRDVHGKNVRGENGGSTKIQLEFRVRRSGYDGAGYEEQTIPDQDDFQYGLDGEAFVPEDLPRQRNEPEITDANHAQRTKEFREQAAKVREVQEEKEAFPTLGASHGSQGNLIGWTSDKQAKLKQSFKTRGQVTKEQFPSLPCAKSNSALMKARWIASQTQNTSNLSTANYAIASQVASMGRTNTPPNRPFAIGTPTPAASSSHPSLRSSNKSANLSSDNFPSLAAPKTKSKQLFKTNKSNSTKSNVIKSTTSNYSAAIEYAKSLKAPSANINNQPTSALWTTPQTNNSQNQSSNKTAKPDITSQSFPTLGGAVSTDQYSSAKKYAKKIQKPPSASAKANVFQPPPPKTAAADPRERLESIKFILGPTKYKNLRNLTKSFAMYNISPISYIDQCARLFPDGGVKDDDFWVIMPQLVESCPDQENRGVATQAMDYLSTLRVAVEAEEPTRKSINYALKAAAPSSIKSFSKPPPSYRAAPPPPPRYKTPKSKSSAWGSGKTKTAPSQIVTSTVNSVVSAAALREQPAGMATSYEAQTRKEELKKKQKQNGLKKSKQKEKKDELRALAFGGK